MDKLADEDHTHHITPEEIREYRNNRWIRSNTVGADTMPVRHRPDFKQALWTLRQLKDKEDAAHQQRWQSYSSSWWNWQESWWHSSYEHHHEDGPSPVWSGKPVEKWLGHFFEVWFTELICWGTGQNSVTANSSLLSPTGGLNTKPPNTEKWLRKLYMKTMATVKSYENKCATNYSITIKKNWNDAHNKKELAQQVHQWRRWLRRLSGAQHALSLHIAHCHGSIPERIHIVTHGHIRGALSLIRLIPFLLPLPRRAVHWAPQHEVHGKQPTLLRCRREWRHPELLHLHHRLWAQPPDTFGELNDSSVPFSFMIPSTDQDVDDDTRRDAYCGTPRTSRLLCTRRHVSQSVVICNVRWIRGSIRKIWCHI